MGLQGGTMNRQDAEEYTESLGQIVVGSWRQVALAQRLGVPEALNMTIEQWVSERLGGYVKLVRDERRKAVSDLSNSGHSTREIAEIIGVSKSTVAADVQNRTDQSETPKPEEKQGAGAGNPAPRKPTAAEKRAIAKAERSQQRIAFTQNIIEAVRVLDRPPSRAKAMAAEFDVDYAKRMSEKISSKRLLGAAAFLNALADYWEDRR
jgi:transposase